jgi:predicted extracellular nuclease
MKKSHPAITSIGEIQGAGLWSALAGRTVTIRGVVTGVMRRGFFVQSVKPGPDPKVSDALYVFSPGWPAIEGALVEVTGEVMDYVKGENSKPVTQLKLDDVRLIRRRGPAIKPFKLTADNVPRAPAELASFLNGLEAMLVSIEAGQTFISPSNPYGDYVLILDADGPEEGVTRTDLGGVLVEHQNPLRWYPGFRISDYSKAPRLNVGSKLLTPLTGPLNYRVEAYQMAVSHPIGVETSEVSLATSTLKPEPGFITIMTMNGFNLDMNIESAERVNNPGQDIDDDWGDRRFHTLAQAAVLQANGPDIIALQEIQDNDGAEISMVVDAGETYKGLIQTIRELSGVSYRWADIAPEVGADGGQPGGSIRNGYLYNPGRVELLQDSVRLIGSDEPAFEGSRKPLIMHFREKISGKELVCINVHLASKRHQNSIFAPEQPGFDAREAVRIEQAGILRSELTRIRLQGLDYYLTGDFNDTEESATLAAVVGDESLNLVSRLPHGQRYDYNHRGKLQVLMHGIVPRELAGQRAEYEIIHGNELLGVQPGQLGDKPSDHAYVIAKIRMN